MGQVQTSEQGSMFVLQDHVNRHANELKQLASMSYSSFITSLEELNRTTDSIVDSSGKKLLFHIKKGSDSTFLWKATVRIKCHKVNGITGAIESSRVLNLKQYIHLQNEITRYMMNLQQQKQSGSGDEPSGTGTSVDFCASMIITEIDTHLGTQGTEDTERDECCICMDTKSDVILRCSHSYCEKCIDEWYVVNKTCPICRAHVNTGKEAWVLAEKPDTDQMAKEASAYLLGLSDNTGYKDHDDSG